MFTDIEGSTALLQKLGDDYAALLADQRRILRESFAAWNGREVDTQGDAFFVSFPRAADAIEAAIAAQQALENHRWPVNVTVKVRMGIHTGEPEVGEEGYVGMAVHRAARLAHAGHGGQVLLSETTEALIRGELPEEAELRDLGEYRLKDMPRSEHIYQLVLRGLLEEFPPLAAEALVQNNLPQQLTTFIGREQDLVSLHSLLVSERLVTLVGPGGVGKTRLSIQTALDIAARYPDGVWFVELASLTDASLLPQAIAQRFELREQPGQALMDSLLKYLKDRSLLIILDNCEHLIAACAQLASAVLQSCPAVKILATSREVLGVRGESIYPVPTLDVPDPQHLPHTAALLEIESIRLFQARAAAAAPGFALNDQNTRAVAQICRRLDGIPLALELAAARVRVLSPQQIDERLSNSFSLLSSGDRMALPRQQTLRATIDWSHELLTTSEKTLFRRLAVFIDGWTLDAAEGICTGEGGGNNETLDEALVLDLLAHLVDKSLVIKSEQGGTARYHWLETVSQYALEMLAAAQELEALRGRHLAWFLEAAERGEGNFEGPRQSVWLAWLQNENGNLRAALDWSQRQPGTVELGLRLAVALISYWEVAGRFTEGREQLTMLIGQSEATTPPNLLARALLGEADLAYLQSDYPATQALYERSLAMLRELGPEGLPGMADAYIGLGNVATEVGDYGAAPGLFEKGLKIQRQLGNNWGIADALRNLGWCAMRPGDYDLAQDYLEEALAILKQINEDGVATASTLSGLGEVALRKGKYARAEELLRESLELSRKREFKWRTAASLGSLGWAALRQGDAERTRAYLAQSLEIRRELGDQGGTAWCLEKLAELLGMEGRYADQVQVYGAAAALRAPIHSIIDPADQPEYDRIIAAARDELGEVDFEENWRAGENKGIEEAISLGLKE